VNQIVRLLIGQNVAVSDVPEFTGSMFTNMPQQQRVTSAAGVAEFCSARFRTALLTQLRQTSRGFFFIREGVSLKT
jgi:hypothetical protein